MAEELLGKILAARTGQGELQFVGLCVGYCEAPTVTVNLPDGKQARWRADLCDIVALPDDVLNALRRLIDPIRPSCPTKHEGE